MEMTQQQLCDTVATNNHGKNGNESTDAWTTPGQYVREGIPFPAVVHPDVLGWLRNEFSFRSDDILIAAYPKTGSTFLNLILYFIIHPDKLDADPETEIAPIQYLSHFLEMFTAPGIQPNYKLIDDCPVPRIIKTHMPYSFLEETFKRQRPRTVLLFRNPRDTLVSYFHFYRMFSACGNYQGSWDSYFRMYQTNRILYGDLTEHMVDWWKHRNEANTIVVMYEDLKTNVREVIRSLAAFLDKQLSDVEVEKIARKTSFAEMKATPSLNMSRVYGMNECISPFLRKGVVGDWGNHFTEGQIDYLKNKEEKMRLENLVFKM